MRTVSGGCLKCGGFVKIEVTYAHCLICGWSVHEPVVPGIQRAIDIDLSPKWYRWMVAS